MKKKFKQWWSTIQPISTKWTATSCLKPLTINKTMIFGNKNPVPGLGQAQRLWQDLTSWYDPVLKMKILNSWFESNFFIYFIYIYLNKNWKIYWYEQSFTCVGPGGPVLIVRTDWSHPFHSAIQLQINNLKQKQNRFVST